MPFVPVPKDLTRVKTKVAFNLTKRQLVCFGAGGLVGIPTYLFSRASLGNETAALLMIGLMLPFFFFGIYEKDGQPLEKILKHFVYAQFLTPKEPPYPPNNLYAALMRQAGYDKEVSKIEKPKAAQAEKESGSRQTPVSKGEKGVAQHHPSDAG